MTAQSKDLAEVFASATEHSIADADERERVGAALVHALAEARSRYPGVVVEDSEFTQYLGERLKDSDANAAAIASRATSDVFLACACVAGQDKALSTLDSQVFAALPAAMGRLKLNSAAIEEAIQRARTKLLVGQEGRGKLVDFSGTGDLRGWIKVIAIRDALRTARKEKREVSMSDELEAALPAEALDPELAYQRRLYHTEFKASFEAAVDELTARERTLLRQSIVYSSTVDQVAVVYQVHRATAARWIAKAREQLATKTRAHLRERLSISESQFHSIVRLIESQMDLSMERLLATAHGDEKLEDAEERKGETSASPGDEEA
jgi:RNA polymerase sigma-70 factor (ECF subfamily)